VMPSHSSNPRAASTKSTLSSTIRQRIGSLAAALAQLRSVGIGAHSY
jgi:hypothetical protein